MNAARIGRAAAVIAAWLSVAGAAAPAGVRLPEFEQLTLANGAQVALMPRRDTPLVAMHVLVRGGSLADAPGREGTASLLADLMHKGAGARDAAQFAEAIEGAGGSLSVAVDAESLAVGADFLARDVGLMIELAGDVLLRPRLAAEEFAKVRAVAIQSIAAAKDTDPSGLLDAYGDAWLFRDHPYGRPVDGSEESLAAVTLDDLESHYRAQVRGDRLIIAVVGDFDPADVRARLERAFGTLPRAEVLAPVATAAAREQGRRVLLVDKPGAAQTYFWLGNVGATRTDPERTVQTVVNTVFGGRYTSMLNTELRMKSGLTYGAGSGFDRLAQPGAFRISSFTATESTVPALDMALATLDRLHRDGVDAATLESAKSYLQGQFPPTLETNGALAGRLTDLMLHGLGREDVDGFSARVAAADDASARRAIDSAFPRSGDLVIVLVGDAARIRSDVGRYGAVTEMKLTDPRFSPR
ncbi:MAG: insulinase family protein [Steroidobacteraceae bacterium]|nr:insulinase family protein [Steroidobacteraceae bacterium]